MKKKITIALDENILEKIDREVTEKKAKNRSASIESHLVKYYWDFTDTSAIIFAHDNKWDNRKYPFDIPKSLLEIRWKSIIRRQIDLFLQSGITDFHISIPIWKKESFLSELHNYFPNNIFNLYEIDEMTLSWDTLKYILDWEKIWEKLFISNGDNFYGSLDIEKYYQFHKKQWADFSFCLKFVMTPEQLWNVVIQWEKIIAFVEKPKAKATYLTNSGVYITTKDFLRAHSFW